MLALSYSCEQDYYFGNESISAFGIRHDKSLSEYEALAANNTGDKPDFSAVVSFSYSMDGSSNEEYIASGILIDPEWILTAGHNFYDAYEDDHPAPETGIIVKVGNDPNNPVQTFGVSEIVFHPSWLDGQQEYEHGNDLCLVKLSSPVINLTPAILHTNATEEIGSKVWFCGFGDYSETLGEDPDLDSKKHAIENILDRKKIGLISSANSVNYSGGLLAFDFDDPEGNINSLGDNIINTDENILGPGTSTSGALEFEGTTVEGDSGGPLFVKNGSFWELCGILSGGATDPIPNHEDGSYGDISIFVRVTPSYNWIQSVIK